MASGYPYQSRGDSRTFAANTKPAKINLLSEEPRRDSLAEGVGSLNIELPDYRNYQQQPQQVAQFGRPQQQQVDGMRSQPPSFSHHQQQQLNHAVPSGSQQFGATTSLYGGQGSQPAGTAMTKTVTTTTIKTITSAQQQQEQQQQQHLQRQQQQQQQYYQQPPTRQQPPPDLTDIEALESKLREEEMRLKRELAYLNQYHNQWSRPPQIREPRREPARRSTPTGSWVKECPSSPASRPTSRASSTRSTTEADLMEKAAKLLADVEELERKPLNKQQLYIENSAKGAPKVAGSAGSQAHVSDVHTAIITVPSQEVDNKSPLPFAFDNFSTLGVRGNIASVGAAPPDTPYPPIFPTIKRTPSPSNYKR